MIPRFIISNVITLLYLTTLCKATKKLIIDTDIFIGADDTTAFLLAATHESTNTELLAANVNYPSSYSALAVSALLGHYNHSHVPVGLRRPITHDHYFDNTTFKQGELASKVGFGWKNKSSLPWGAADEAWDPVELYRKVLAGEEEKSVTIASIGFFDNLAGLLDSRPDSYSALSGEELVMTKVKNLVIMGGEYPSGSEFNFYKYTPAATARVVNHWPGEMIFSGYELAENVMTGARFTVGGPKCDPARAAYEWSIGYNTTRPSWDPITMLYAIQGAGDLLTFENSGGHNHVYQNGSNAWLPGDPEYPQHYLKLKVPDGQAAEVLDRMFIDGANRFC